MGVVFRAHDTQLQRDVALKLLPNDFASDPDRLSRFQREAQVLASLNHPNIAQIYGLEGAGESRCIVMELVDGETLVENGQTSRVDEAALLARVQQAGEEYWATLPQWRAKNQTIDDVAPMSFNVRKAN